MENKITLIGYGRWGKNWLKTLLNYEHKPYEVVGIVDPVLYKEMKEYDDRGFKIPVYPSVRAVPNREFTHAIVATPPASHYENFNLLSTKINPRNILIEKPMGKNEDLYNAMSAAFPAMVWLYDDYYLAFKKLLHEQDELLHIKFERASMGPTVRRDVSIIEDYMFHDFYLFFDLFSNSNMDSYSIRAYNETDFFSSKSGVWPQQADVSVCGVFNSINAQFFSSWWYPRKLRKVVAICDKKSIIWEDNSIFIYNSHYDLTKEDEYDQYNNKGIRLVEGSEEKLDVTINSSKSNLERLLDDFLFNNSHNLHFLMKNTWKLISKIYKKRSFE